MEPPNLFSTYQCMVKYKIYLAIQICIISMSYYSNVNSIVNKRNQSNEKISTAKMNAESFVLRVKFQNKTKFLELKKDELHWESFIDKGMWITNLCFTGELHCGLFSSASKRFSMLIFMVEMPCIWKTTLEQIFLRIRSIR